MMDSYWLTYRVKLTQIERLYSTFSSQRLSPYNKQNNSSIKARYILLAGSVVLQNLRFLGQL